MLYEVITRDIATKIPMVVKRLSGRLSPDAVPAIGVRFAREFFHASQVGYFAPADSGNQYTLVEGVGFPLDWKGKVRLAADEGILAMCLQNKTITTVITSYSIHYTKLYDIGCTCGRARKTPAGQIPAPGRCTHRTSRVGSPSLRLPRRIPDMFPSGER